MDGQQFTSEGLQLPGMAQVGRHGAAAAAAYWIVDAKCGGEGAHFDTRPAVRIQGAPCPAPSTLKRTNPAPHCCTSAPRRACTYPLPAARGRSR